MNNNKNIPYSEIDEMKQGNLAEFAMDKYGYELDKKGSTSKLIRLEKIDNHSEWMVIRKNGVNGHQTFYNQNNQKGTVYDLIQQKEGLTFRESHLKYKDNTLIKESSNLQRSSEIKTVDAETRKKYLSYQPLTNTRYLESRGIENETLQSPQFKGRVFNKEVTMKSGAKYKNTAFPIYKFNNDNTIGANNTHNGLELHNFKFKGAATGSIKTGAVWLSNFNPNKPIDRITVTESPLDAMSKWQIKDSKERKNDLYISTVGPVTEENTKTIQRIVRNHPQAQIIDATDNDITGDRYSVAIKNSLGNKEKKITENAVSVKPIVREGSAGISIELNHGKAGAKNDVKKIENIFNDVVKSSNAAPGTYAMIITENNANKTTVEIRHPNTRDNWKVSNQLTNKIVGAENIKVDKSYFSDWTQDSEISKGIFKDTPNFKLKDLQQGNGRDHIKLTAALNKAIESHLQPLQAKTKGITQSIEM